MKHILLTFALGLMVCLSSMAEDIIWEFGDKINNKLIEFLNEYPQYRDAPILIRFYRGHRADDKSFLLEFNTLIPNTLPDFPRTNRYVLLDGSLFPVYFDIDFILYQTEEDRERNKTAEYPARRRTFFINDGTYFIINPYHGKIKRVDQLRPAKKVKK